jgi:hypothetical protein
MEETQGTIQYLNVLKHQFLRPQLIPWGRQWGRLIHRRAARGNCASNWLQQSFWGMVKMRNHFSLDQNGVATCDNSRFPHKRLNKSGSIFL